MPPILDFMSEKYASVRRRRELAAQHPTKSERTGQAILDAALEFLWSNQFRDLSVSELMSSLPVGRSAFYQYFADLQELMQAVLRDLEQEILSAATPWLNGNGDAMPAMRESLSRFVNISYARGPILRAVHDAAATDQWLETLWNQFLGRFDDAVTDRIERDQKAGLTPDFDARAVAVSLNRMNAYTVIQAFGHRPRKDVQPVLESLFRIWASTLYPALTDSDAV